MSYTIGGLLGQATAISFIASLVTYPIFKITVKNGIKLNAKAFWLSFLICTVFTAVTILLFNDVIDTESLLMIVLVSPAYYYILRRLSNNSKFIKSSNSEV